MFCVVGSTGCEVLMVWKVVLGGIGCGGSGATIEKDLVDVNPVKECPVGEEERCS